MQQLSRQQIQEGHANALVLRDNAQQQVEYWERMLNSASVQPASKRKVERKQALAEFKASIIQGHVKPSRKRRTHAQ